MYHGEGQVVEDLFRWCTPRPSLLADLKWVVTKIDFLQQQFRHSEVVPPCVAFLEARCAFLRSHSDCSFTGVPCVDKGQVVGLCTRHSVARRWCCHSASGAGVHSTLLQIQSSFLFPSTPILSTHDSTVLVLCRLPRCTRSSLQ